MTGVQTCALPISTEVALALAGGIGCTRAGVTDSDFESETVTDPMTEQALLPVFVSALRAKYETGVAPETVLMEQYLSREMSHIWEQAATQGPIEQLTLHSQTSQYGQLRFSRNCRRESPAFRAGMNRRHQLKTPKSAGLGALGTYQ